MSDSNHVLSELVPHKHGNAPGKTVKHDTSTAVQSDEQIYPTGLRFWLIMLSLAASLMITGLDMNIVATAVPSITNEFQTTADIGWYASAFRLAGCAILLLSGQLNTLFSVKKTFVTFVAIFLVGSVLCAAARTSAMFVIGRAITGLATGGVAAGALNVLVYAIPLAKRPMWMGAFAALEGLSVVAGPLLGGVITQYVTWRWCFWINLPMTAPTLILTAVFLEDTPHIDDACVNWRQRVMKLDLLSAFLLVASLLCLFLAFTWAGTLYDWRSGVIIGLLVTFAVLGIAFAYNQYRRGDAAIVPPRIITQRSVLASVIWMTFCNAAGGVLEYYLPIYFQSVAGYTPAQSGYLLIPLIFLGIVGVALQGVLTSMIGYYTPFMLASSVLMAVSAGLITSFGVGTQLGKLIGYTALWGLAYGIGFLGPQAAVQTALRKTDIPSGLAIILFAQSFGPAVAYTIAQVVFTNELTSRLLSIFPGLDVAALTQNGLSDLVTRAPAGRAQDVVAAISQSFEPVWEIVTAFACVTIIGSAFAEWLSVKKEPSDTPEATRAETNDTA